LAKNLHSESERTIVLYKHFFVDQILTHISIIHIGFSIDLMNDICEHNLLIINIIIYCMHASDRLEGATNKSNADKEKLLNTLPLIVDFEYENIISL
jgi:hypothetical protein